MFGRGGGELFFEAAAGVPTGPSTGAVGEVITGPSIRNPTSLIGLAATMVISGLLDEYEMLQLDHEE